MDSPPALTAQRRRVLLALAGSLALHAILLIGLNLRPLPEHAFDTVTRHLPLAAVLRPQAAATRIESAARPPRAASTSTPRAMLRPDPPAAQPTETPAQTFQTAPRPRFDLESLRQQARALGQGKQHRESPVAPQNLGQVLPEPALERDTPLSKSIAKAKRPDCKTAHAHWGLFAIPLLIYDTATESGCQW